jgi:hypothetical protein
MVEKMAAETVAEMAYPMAAVMADKLAAWTANR